MKSDSLFFYQETTIFKNLIIFPGSEAIFIDRCIRIRLQSTNLSK